MSARLAGRSAPATAGMSAQPTAAVGGIAAAGTSASAGAGAAPSSGGSAAPAGQGSPAAGSGGVAAGSGGMIAAGGAGGEAAAGADGAAAGSGSTPTGSCKPWPTANGSQSVTATIKVSGTYDGMLKRFVGSGALGSGSQDEGQDAMFELANGSTLKNVVIGAPAADGVHCKGSCTLENVWWEDVGEDAATLEGSSASQVMSIECSGARKADDKVFQHNGPGTMKLNNVYVDTFGKLYRSCGNCKTQNERHVEMSNIDAKGGKAALAGINTNYNDTARFTNITIHDTAMKLDICDRYTGNNTGAEPSKTGSGPDGSHCIYSASDIHWQP
jgi:pectate lyase